MDPLSSMATLGAVLVLSVLVIFAIGLAAERIAPAQPRQPARAIRLNISYAVFHACVRAAVATMAAAVPVLGIGMLGGGLIPLPREGGAVVLSVILYLVIIDGAEYLFHRAQHALPFLWALHSLHHSDRAVNVTTTTRHHWADIFIRSLVIYPIVGLLFAVPYQAVLANGIVGYYNYFLHLNIKISFGRWSAVLNSPQYHRVHHSDEPRLHNRNFAALFPVFDLVFGTYYRPAGGEYPTTGLAGREGPHGVWGAILWPLRRGAAVAPWRIGFGHLRRRVKVEKTT